MNINEWLLNHPRHSSRGAPIGDPGTKGARDYPYKFYLQPITMMDGDYAPDGTYWGGSGDKLYGYMGYEQDSLLVRGFVRASYRAMAKEKVRIIYPKARFFR